MHRIQTVLKKYWGFESLRPLQHEAIQAALSGRDSLVVLPTGGGKSLCFQAPAVALDGTTLVISPLIALMKDQVDALTQCGVPAGRLDSSQDWNERRATLEQLRNGALKLLYVSPERLLSDGFAEILRELRPAMIAVDEAHCISMWGHDFRPEYTQLSRLREIFSGLPIHAFTATATDHVRQDIIRQLQLRDPEVLIGSFHRPNLHYSVQHKSDPVRQIKELIDRRPGESGIIYCIRRKDVDELTERLVRLGYKAAPYHAGMEAEARKRSQTDFIEDRVQIIVATVAFGMGIDKPNVRFVIHSGLPKSIEHYQQETGRAGRDGLLAECRLLWQSRDAATWRFIIEQSHEDLEVRRIALDKLRDMENFASGVTCRHSSLIGYFGETLDGDNCSACDICHGELEIMVESKQAAQKILSCVVRLKEMFGADYTCKVLIGSNDERIRQNGHDALSTYGLLADQPYRQVRDWTEQLIVQDYLAKTGEYNQLSVTSKGWLLLRDETNETPKLSKPVTRKTRAEKRKAVDQRDWSGVDRGLYKELRRLCKEIAEIKRIPPYMVFGDAALRDMARRRPATLDNFIQITGVGERKLKQYGKDFTEVIRKYCRNNSLDTNLSFDAGLDDDRSHHELQIVPDDGAWSIEKLKRQVDSLQPQAPPANNRRGAKWTKEEDENVRAMFYDGLPPKEIANKFGRSRGAIRSRLIKLGLVDPDESL
ncbi:DNA helicase RecQ [Candidatus Sumerlaeota bacterium]|nr:DNA helicase RecQ [Candidatus Sumerlaeota bacterium]